MFAQDVQYTVTVQKQTIAVNVEDDVTDKILHIDLTQPLSKGEELIVTNNLWKDETDWKRSFIIFDKTDNQVASLTETPKDGIYCLPSKEIKKNLQSGKKYTLYTIATPKDPQQAMLVKVRRQLICTIEIL